MAVLARYRKASKYKFYSNAITIRRKMINFLLRDLGVKKTVRNYRINTNNMTPEDADLMVNLMQKYNITGFPADYPVWIIDHFRNNIWNILNKLHMNITNAYTLWAQNPLEIAERRIYQDRAIAACENLLQEIQIMADVLPLDINKLLAAFEQLIEQEILLLKGWRKSDNKKNRQVMNTANNKSLASDNNVDDISKNASKNISEDVSTSVSENDQQKEQYKRQRVDKYAPERSIIDNVSLPSSSMVLEE